MLNCIGCLFTYNGPSMHYQFTVGTELVSLKLLDRLHGQLVSVTYRFLCGSFWCSVYVQHRPAVQDSQHGEFTCRRRVFLTVMPHSPLILFVATVIPVLVSDQALSKVHLGGHLAQKQRALEEKLEQ